MKSHENFTEFFLLSIAPCSPLASLCVCKWPGEKSISSYNGSENIRTQTHNKHDHGNGIVNVQQHT